MAFSEYGTNDYKHDHINSQEEKEKQINILTVQYKKVFISGFKKDTTVHVRVENASQKLIDELNKQAKEKTILTDRSRGGKCYIQDVNVQNNKLW